MVTMFLVSVVLVHCQFGMEDCGKMRFERSDSFSHQRGLSFAVSASPTFRSRAWQLDRER